MKTFKMKTLAGVLGAVVLCSAAAGTYYANAYLQERSARRAAAEFLGLVTQPLQLQWSGTDNGPAAAAGRVTELLWSRDFDDSYGMAAALADQIAQSPLKGDQEAVAAAHLLEYQVADLGYGFARGAYVALTGAVGAAPADLEQSVREAQSTIALLARKLAEASAGQSAHEPDEHFIAANEYLGDIKQGLQSFADASAGLQTPAWRTAFYEPARLSGEQQKALVPMAEAAAKLTRVDERVHQEIDQARKQTALTGPALRRQALRLQILTKAYRATLIPYSRQPESAVSLVALEFDTLGQEQLLAAPALAGAPGEASGILDEEVGFAATRLYQVARSSTEKLGGSAATQQLAPLMGGGKGLVYMRGVAEDETGTHAFAGSVREFRNLTDYFWQASLLSAESKQGTPAERTQQALDASFGALLLTDVTPAADGKSIDFKVEARKGLLTIKGSVPTTPERIAADTSALEASKPIIVFRQEGEQLALAGMAIEGKRIAYVRHQVPVPVRFAAEPARQWKARLAEQEEVERLAAEEEQRQREKEADKAFAEREKALLQDPVYRLANAYIAQMRPLPPCVAMAQAMRNMASSQAPAHVREMQVEAMFNKIPETCFL